MQSPDLLSQVDSPTEISGCLEWHRKHGVPLLLMSVSSGGPIPARLLDLDMKGSILRVICTGLREKGSFSRAAYAAIGSTPAGANFLASGSMSPDPETSDCYILSFPQWIDVAQSRDCFRCPAPSGHVLHFTATHPQRMEMSCRVQNVSLGGLGLIWENREGYELPGVGSLTEGAMLQSRDGQVPLGALRVSHVTPGKRLSVIGLKFVQDSPRQFNSLVLGAQRAQLLI